MESRIIDNTLVFHFTERLDTLAAMGLQKEITAAVDAALPSCAVRFDFAGVEYISSGFLRIVMIVVRMKSGNFSIVNAARRCAVFWRWPTWTNGSRSPDRQGAFMKISDVKNCFAMPLASPSYAPGPYQFRNREFLIIEYETDPDALARAVPEPLEVYKPVVKYEFIKMPDSDGFGSYEESGRSFRCCTGAKRATTCTPCISTTSRPSSRAGIWGFPKKFARPQIAWTASARTATLAF